MGTISVRDISDAQALVAEFCSPTNGYAWPLYDEDASPQTLSGADLTAPALTSYPIPGKYLNEMGRQGSTYAELVYLMSQFVATDACTPFSKLDAAVLDGLSTRKVGEPILGPEDWRAFVRCLDAAGGCKGITSVAVTKILHRKRPDLVPINDSRLREFYGVRQQYDMLFRAIHADLQAPLTREMLSEIAEDRSTPGGRPLTDLRALDIVVWMHMGR